MKVLVILLTVVDVTGITVVEKEVTTVV